MQMASNANRLTSTNFQPRTLVIFARWRTSGPCWTPSVHSRAPFCWASAPAVASPRSSGGSTRSAPRRWLERFGASLEARGRRETGDSLSQKLGLGPWKANLSADFALFRGGGGFPTKIDYSKKDTLILTSLLEDLARFFLKYWVQEHLPGYL